MSIDNKNTGNIRPNHYKLEGLYKDNKEPAEVLDYIKSILTPEEYRGFLKGNIIKYISREQDKNGVEDINKSIIYSRWLAEYDKGKEMGENRDECII